MLDSIRTDVAYAVKQLRRFGDVGRALDALERVQEALAEPEAVGCEFCPAVGGGCGVCSWDVGGEG